MTEAVASQRLLIDPPPADWTLGAGHTLDECCTFRAQLGLPADGPVVVSGHQALFWHPGILAKVMATVHGARRLGAAPAWIVVDQDVARRVEVVYPVRSADGSLERSTWTLVDTRDDEQISLGHRPVLHDVEPPTNGASEPIRSGLTRIGAALREAQGTASLGDQVGAATRTMLSDLGLDLVFVRALDISKTDVFRAIVERMADDPALCARTYNAAIANGTGTRLRPLIEHAESGRVELPLWRVGPGEARRPAYAEDLAAGSPESFAPRALLMTGLLRRYGCDLFVHGTGGGGVEADDDSGYERVADAWLDAWLGESPAAPYVVATATCLLDLEPRSPVEPEDLTQARDLAHKARHDPAIVGDADRSASKRALVEEIARVKETGGNPAPLFQRMQALLKDYRAAHEAEFARLDAEVERIERALQDAEVLSDRTWAFPLYAQETLLELDLRIREACGVE